VKGIPPYDAEGLELTKAKGKKLLKLRSPPNAVRLETWWKDYQGDDETIVP